MRRAVGIDLGSSRVKVAVLDRRGKTFRLHAAAVIPRNGPPAGVAEEVRRFLADWRALACPCELAISAVHWRLRHWQLPDRPGLVRNLRALAAQELADELDDGGESLIVDACALERGQGAVTALVFAADREAMADWLEAFQACGLGIDGIHPDVLALHAALVAFGKLPAQQRATVVDLGGGAAKLLWLQGTALEFAATFVYAPARSESPPSAPDPALLREAGAQLGLALAGRLPPVGAPLLLHGGLAKSESHRSAFLAGFAGVLALPEVRDIVSHGLEPGLSPETLCAAGAALHQWDQETPRADLRREVLADPRRRRRALKPALTLAIALTVGLGLIGLLLGRAARQAQREAQEADRRMQGLWKDLFSSTPLPAHIPGRLTSERLRLEGLAGQFGELPRYHDLLETLRRTFEHLPADTPLYLSNLNLSQEGLALDGEVGSHARTQELAQALQGAPGLAVSPPASTQAASGAVGFALKASLQAKGQNP